MLYSSADFHNLCPDVRILTCKATLPLLVVRRGVNPFLHSCWHVCTDYFILCNGRYDSVWEINRMIWSGLKSCSFTHNWGHKPLQKMIHPWWTQDRKQICSAREHEFPESLLQRNCRANSELNCTITWQSSCSSSTVSEETVFLPQPSAGRKGISKFPSRKWECSSAPSADLPLWG